MHHTGRVVSRTELVEHLYDQDFDRDSNTIEVFVGRIRKKLDVDIIQTVRGLGYLLTPPRRRLIGADQQRLALVRMPPQLASIVRTTGPCFRDHVLMRANSLATRLFLSATAWVVVILLITGFVLSSVYRDATERAFDRRLNLYLRTLIAEVATPDEPPDRQFQSLGEPLFELPLSGWYWQITRTDSEKPEVRASRSLWDKKLPKLDEHGAELTRGRHPPRLCRRSGRPEPAHGGTAGRSRRRRQVPGQRRRRRLGDFRRDAQLRLLPRRHLRRARHRAAAHHHLPGPLRSRAAEAHFGIDRRHPLRPRRAAGRRISRSRSRRWRARPMR